MKKNLMYYTKTGFKLWIILFIGALIMIIPQMLIFGASFAAILGGELNLLKSGFALLTTLIICILLAFTVNGWLLIKYKNFIIK